MYAVLVGWAMLAAQSRAGRVLVPRVARGRPPQGHLRSSALKGSTSTRSYFDAAVCPGTGEADRAAVGVRLDPDLEAGRGRVDHEAVADHDADVAGRGDRSVGAGEEDQVTGFDLARVDPRAPEPLLVSGPGDVEAGRAVGHHRQARAVEGVGAGAAPQVGLAEFLPGEGAGAGGVVARRQADGGHAFRRVVPDRRADDESAPGVPVRPAQHRL